jgi:3-hydroxybutyryl-CoA dehydrogenase
MTMVGVVGAGVMGAGVADNAARCGHDVVLLDADPAASRAALERIERDCRLSRLVTGHAIDAMAVVNRISVADGLFSLRDCEIIVENVPEKWDLKRSVYAELDRVCPPETILVVNTSAIPITRIGSATRRPDRVIGVHFMNPVPMKTTVELIPGRLTSEDTLKKTQEFLASLGKEPILIKDSCGFVSNRVLMLTINEAAFLVYEGNVTAATVDDIFRRCFGHPTGPLETADLIGVDTVLNSIEVLYEHFADSKYRPCPLLREMAAAGLHGRKSGRGFYSYDSAALSPGALGT